MRSFALVRRALLCAVVLSVILTEGPMAKAATSVTLQGGDSAGNWSPIPSTRLLGARSRAVALWTGQVVIVWGGSDSPTTFDDGARFNPVTNTWTSLPPTSILRYPYAAAAVWTGRELLVWDEYGRCPPEPDPGQCGGGARLNATTNAWSPIPPSGLARRSSPSAVWTGKELIVWGGAGTGNCGQSDCALGDGAAYDPVTNTWRRLSTIGAPTPRSGQSAVWDGRELLVWGGTPDENTTFLNNGAAYDPSTDTWHPLPAPASLAPRAYQTAVWTGHEMLIWGGLGRIGAPLNDGAAYNPAAETWRPIASAGAPAARYANVAAWTGHDLLIWGGYGCCLIPAYLSSGASYDPITDAWTPMPSTGAPIGRVGAASVWTGRELFVWGGARHEQVLDDGARFAPPPVPTALPATGAGGTARDEAKRAAVASRWAVSAPCHALLPRLTDSRRAPGALPTQGTAHPLRKRLIHSTRSDRTRPPYPCTNLE